MDERARLSSSDRAPASSLRCSLQSCTQSAHRQRQHEGPSIRTAMDTLIAELKSYHAPDRARVLRRRRAECCVI
eukprot:3224404-Prymnesium_polylepis.1